MGHACSGFGCEPWDIWSRRIREITAAFEAVLKDMGLTDRNDPATLMVAKLAIDLAKQGQFTAATLRARVLKEMKPKRLLN